VGGSHDRIDTVKIILKGYNQTQWRYLQLLTEMIGTLRNVIDKGTSSATLTKEVRTLMKADSSDHGEDSSPVSGATSC
jgi:hypothetical protein